MYRWHARVEKLKAMEHDGAAVIIKKLRLRMCRQALDRYVSQCKVQRQEEQTERRCDYYL